MHFTPAHRQCFACCTVAAPATMLCRTILFLAVTGVIKAVSSKTTKIELSLDSQGDVWKAIDTNWINVINQFLAAHAEHYNSGDVEALVQDYTADGRLLVPGLPVFVGTEALRRGYQHFLEESSVVVSRFEVTTLRYHCNNSAVAEVTSVEIGETLRRTNGVVLLRLDEKGMKIETYVRNFDN